MTLGATGDVIWANLMPACTFVSEAKRFRYAVRQAFAYNGLAWAVSSRKPTIILSLQMQRSPGAGSKDSFAFLWTSLHRLSVSSQSSFVAIALGLGWHREIVSNDVSHVVRCSCEIGLRHLQAFGCSPSFILTVVVELKDVGWLLRTAA